MKRRELMILAGWGAAAYPLAALAQQPALKRRIGVLHQYSANDLEGQRRLAALVQELENLGWSEKRNITFEIRYAGGNFDGLPTFFDELLKCNVEVIITSGTEPIEAARRLTKKIPIVMATIGDPIGAGIVTSLARPEGNITGLSNLATELEAKRLQFLTEVIADLTIAAVLWKSDNASVAQKFNRIKTASQTRGIEIVSLPVLKPEDIANGFGVAKSANVQALIIADDVFLASRRSRIIELAMQHKLPVSSEFRQFADAGGLFSYGPDQIDMWRRAASYVDKILKGANPTDLPIEQPTRFELVINLKTARTLGLQIPPTLMTAADELIE